MQVEISKSFTFDGVFSKRVYLIRRNPSHTKGGLSN